MSEQIAIWVPNDLNLNIASQTRLITNHMLSNNRNVILIDVNTAYHNRFEEYYDQHIKQNETAHTTFCFKNGAGINVGYLIDNANKHTYATLLFLDVDPDDSTKFEVLAMLVFKWSPTAKAVKIQAFCGNQKRPSKGAGTKLLNFLKKTLSQMNINNIYLNPVPNAIAYYSNNQFVYKPGKKVHDSSSPKPKSSSPKLKSSSPKKPKGISTMTINLRAVKNWKKTKNILRSYQAITRKLHGKSHIPTSIRMLWVEVDKVIAKLSSDDREIAQCGDIISRLSRLTDDEEDIVCDYLRKKYNI